MATATCNRNEPAELTEKLVAAIESGKYDTIICNHPNGDMVGHTPAHGSRHQSAVEALITVIEQATKAVESVGGQSLITATTATCVEQMRDPATVRRILLHTNLPVPLIWRRRENEGGRRRQTFDIAPTVVAMYGKLARDTVSSCSSWNNPPHEERRLTPFNRP